MKMKMKTEMKTRMKTKMKMKTKRMTKMRMKTKMRKKGGREAEMQRGREADKQRGRWAEGQRSSEAWRVGRRRDKMHPDAVTSAYSKNMFTPWLCLFGELYQRIDYVRVCFCATIGFVSPVQ